jgi:hypothetical protein
MSDRLFVHVDTHGLQDKFDVFTSRGARSALGKGARRAGARGRTLTRAGAPVRTGIGRAGIRSTSRLAGDIAIARVYPSGAHAHIMRWQDQGTGEREQHSTGRRTGMVEAQFFFERAALALDDELPAIFDSVVNDALREAGLT